MTKTPALLSLLLPLAVALAGAETAAQGGKPSFKVGESTRPFALDPCFDYTRLREPDPVWWERLSTAPIDLRDALVLARGDREDVRVGGARYVAGTRSYYLIELWKQDSDEPELVRIAVDDSSFLSPEDVVGRETCFDHGDSEPQKVKRTLFAAKLLAENALEVTAGAFNATTRPYQVTFVTQEKDRRFETQIYTWHEKVETTRRWHVVVPGDTPAMRMKIYLDRYPGNPLMKSVATTLPSGIEVYDFEVGDGEVAQEDSTVRINYRLVLLDNQVVYNSKNDRKKPTFSLSEAPMKGLALGIPGMRVGGLRKIVMPAELAYGAEGHGLIPPGAMIVADVGLEAVE